MTGKLVPFNVDDQSDIVKDANVRILQVIAIGKRQIDCIYHIQYLCCGREAMLSHAQIKKRALDTKKKRIRTGNLKLIVTCYKCRRKMTSADYYKTVPEEPPELVEPVTYIPPNYIPMPLWPVPPSIMENRKKCPR